jgi:hypothetical protein
MMKRITTVREMAMAQANFLPTLARMVLSLCMGAVPLALQATANFTAISSAEKASNVEPTSQPAPPKKTKKAKAPKPPVNPSTGENKSERDKRLLRECRGKPNAGACEGYAS